MVDVAAQHAPDDPFMADTHETRPDRKPFAGVRQKYPIKASIGIAHTNCRAATRFVCIAG